MNMKEIARTLTGSVVVYAIVASCSPSSGRSGPAAQLGIGGRDASASHAESGNGGKPMIDAAIDRMVAATKMTE